MSKHTPGPWRPDGHNIIDRTGRVIAGAMHSKADARLIAAAPALLALAHQYASECGDCAGTRVCPDDSPCTECADIWAVIDRAEGRT